VKNVTLILASVAVMLFASCKNETEKTTEKTVVIEKQVEETPAPIAPVVEDEKDGTSVNINKDGVEFSTKDGKKKTEIEVKENGGSFSTK